MKQYLCLISFIIISQGAAAQAPGTARLDNLKDAWDLKVTYVGQVKNGKPNGLGQFIYDNGYALKYVGYFVDGLPKGKGVLLMNDGAFLWGDWDKGKLNGQGVNLSGNGTLYMGSFKNGMRNGRGTMVYSENNFVTGSFLNDKLHGRCTFLSAEGKLLSENVYQNGEKEGPGYQYEVKDKKLFKGIWHKGGWSGAAEVPFQSFLTDTRFMGELTTNRVLMGCIGPDKKLQDTGFVYDLTNRKRFFGAFENGKLRRGLIIRDDSTVVYGSYDDKGATGNCSFLKRGMYYDEGMYVEDHLRGPSNLSIELDKKTVYYGQTAGSGEFTGKAWFSSTSSSIYNGDYKSGKFTGTGWKLDSSGYCTGGEWENGALKKLSFLTQPNGQPMKTAPATLGEGIRQALLLSKVNFNPVKGASTDHELFVDFDAVYDIPCKMVPGSTGDFLASLEDNYLHLAIMYETADEKTALAKFTALCKQVAATSLSLGKPGTVMKLSTTDKIVPANPEKALASFSIVGDAGKQWQDVNVMVILLYSMYLDSYEILLAVGSEYAAEEWLDYY